MKIGITYDIKEQYGFTSLDLNFTDFLNVADVSFAKEVLFLPFWRAMGLHIPEQILMAAHFAWIKYKPNSLQTF